MLALKESSTTDVPVSKTKAGFYEGFNYGLGFGAIVSALGIFGALAKRQKKGRNQITEPLL